MRVVVATLVVLVLAGCSSSVAGTASPAGRAPADPSSADPAAGAGTSFDPCTDLTDADITSFGLNPTSKSDASVADGALGRGCGWRNDDVVVGFLVGDLAARTSDFATIERTSLAGTDAVLLQIDDTGNCAVAVASEETAVIVSVTNTFSSLGTVDPCSVATTVTRALVPILPQ